MHFYDYCFKYKKYFFLYLTFIASYYFNLHLYLYIKKKLPGIYLALNQCNEPFVVHSFFEADWHNLFYFLHMTDSFVVHVHEPMKRKEK